tara:strand:- start:772 stop:1671 length:900 start_codon:yes stop_codon:yes gene_type:complete
MGLSITSNYSGKAAGIYVSAALKQAKTLEFLTILENVKFKTNIQKVAGASLIKDATCDFTDAGTLTMTEKVLTPKNLQINVDLCKKDLLSSWEANQMGAGSFNREAPDFNSFVISYLASSIADGVEGACWTGTNAGAGSFEGFLTASTGAFAVDGGTTSSSASAAYTAGNIIANLGQLAADIDSEVYGSEDLYLYMNKKTYRFYISAISALSAFPFNHMGEYTPEFEGLKIAVCPGMPDNQIVAAQQSNLFFGTDLVSDHTEIRLLDMTALDGSDNLRVVAKYSAGVQVGVGADVCVQA